MKTNSSIDITGRISGEVVTCLRTSRATLKPCFSSLLAARAIDFRRSASPWLIADRTSTGEMASSSEIMSPKGVKKTSTAAFRQLPAVPSEICGVMNYGERNGSMDQPCSADESLSLSFNLFISLSLSPFLDLCLSRLERSSCHCGIQ